MKLNKKGNVVYFFIALLVILAGVFVIQFGLVIAQPGIDAILSADVDITLKIIAVLLPFILFILLIYLTIRRFN